jgi:hypothetical protein
MTKTDTCEVRPLPAAVARRGGARGDERGQWEVCGGDTLRTSPAGTGERRLEEGHSGAVPLHGTAVPLLTNGACTPCQPAIDRCDRLQVYSR